MIEKLRVAINKARQNCSNSDGSISIERITRAVVITLGVLSLMSCSPFRPMQPEVNTLKRERSVDIAHSDGAERAQKGVSTGPVRGYLIDSQPSLAAPSHPLTSHRFCNKVNAHFMQCLLFNAASESDNKSVSISGIEYIISKELFGTLAEEDRYGWNAHDSRILSYPPGRSSRETKEGRGHRVETAEGYGKVWRVQNNTLNREGKTRSVEEQQRVELFSRLGNVRAKLEQNREHLVAIYNKALRSDERDRSVQWQSEYARAMANKRAHKRIHQELSQDHFLERGSTSSASVAHR